MKITKIKSTNRIEGIETIAVLEIMSDEKVEVSELPESIGGYTIGAGSIIHTPDGDFVVMGETEWGNWRTHGGGGGSELPEVTSADNGDVLTVVEGAWEKAAPESELPSVTSDDNGDVLTVVEGAWEKATPESELPSVTSDDNGDVLTVVEGAWGKAAPESELPSVTSDDNGDVLTVVEGAWSKAAPPAPTYVDDWVNCDITYRDNTPIDGTMSAKYSPSRNLMSIGGYIHPGGKSGPGTSNTLCKITIPDSVDNSHFRDLGYGMAIPITESGFSGEDMYYGAYVKKVALASSRELEIDVAWNFQYQGQLDAVDFYIGSFVY